MVVFGPELGKKPYALPESSSRFRNWPLSSSGTGTEGVTAEARSISEWECIVCHKQGDAACYVNGSTSAFV